MGSRRHNFYIRWLHFLNLVYLYRLLFKFSLWTSINEPHALVYFYRIRTLIAPKSLGLIVGLALFYLAAGVLSIQCLNPIKTFLEIIFQFLALKLVSLQWQIQFTLSLLQFFIFSPEILRSLQNCHSIQVSFRLLQTLLLARIKRGIISGRFPERKLFHRRCKIGMLSILRSLAFSIRIFLISVRITPSINIWLSSNLLLIKRLMNRHSPLHWLLPPLNTDPGILLAENSALANSSAGCFF